MRSPGVNSESGIDLRDGFFERHRLQTRLGEKRRQMILRGLLLVGERDAMRGEPQQIFFGDDLVAFDETRDHGAENIRRQVRKDFFAYLLAPHSRYERRTLV